MKGPERKPLNSMVAITPLDVVAGVHLSAIVLDALHTIRLPCTVVNLKLVRNTVVRFCAISESARLSILPNPVSRREYQRSSTKS